MGLRRFNQPNTTYAVDFCRSEPTDRTGGRAGQRVQADAMLTRRTLTLAVALLLAGTLAFPSTAAPLFDGPADRVGDGIELAPSSDYAYLEDEELVVDVSPANPALDGEGLNPDGVTTLGDVFRIQYTGSTYAHVWLTHDGEGISFAVDGQSIGSQAENVTLAPNESVPVSMTVNTTGVVDGYIGDINVHARVAEPADEPAAESAQSGRIVRSVIDGEGSRQFSASSTGEGDRIEFDARRLELDRAVSGSLTLEELAVGTTGGPLSIAVEAVDSQTASDLVESGAEPLGGVTVAVESGEVKNATLRFSISEAYFENRSVDPANLTVLRESDGERSRLPVRVTGMQDGRVTFAAETPGFSTFVVAIDRPRLSVTDVTLDQDTVARGESVTVSTVVTNDGSATGEREITVSVDNRTVAERTVEVAPGTNETVRVGITANTTGEHVVAVDGTERGTFEVESTSSDSTTPTATADDPTTTEQTHSGDETATAQQDTAAPVEEPGAFGLPEFAGLFGVLVIVAALLALGRRVPRP